MYKENNINLDIIHESERRRLDRPITGIIHKDRIWEQWYSEEAMNQSFPQMNQKDYLYSCIGDEPNRVIIDYRGLRQYTFSEFAKMVDSYTRAFMIQNLAVGDVICTISLTTPELYAIKYAATSLGLITCNLNVLDVAVIDDGINRLMRQLDNVNPRMIFILDYLEDKVSAIMNDKKYLELIKVILPLDASVKGMNSEKMGLKILSLKNKCLAKNVKGAISLKSFLKGGKQVQGPTANVYEKGMPCNIAFTSGTTGINKAVLLSHDANNAMAFQQRIGGMVFKRNDKQLALVPPFLAFWDADIVHAVLCMGGVNAIELELSYDKIPGYLVKHKPQLGIWSQYLWDSMLTLSKEDTDQIAASIKGAIVGGERCEINQAVEFYKKTGIVQMAGFGASEVNTTFTISHQHCNKLGTAGIPLPFNNIKILNENGENVGYGTPGRLYITGPCLMNGYYGRPDLTNQVLIRDEDGIAWYDTHDYAIVDTDGCLTVLDRDQDAVEVLYKGQAHMVKLLDMNEIILKIPYVKSSKLNAFDEKVFMYVVFEKEAKTKEEEAIECVLTRIKNEIPEYSWPNIITVLPQLPRTQVGKVDYKVLDSMSRKNAVGTENDTKLIIRRG